MKGAACAAEEIGCGAGDAAIATTLRNNRV